MGRRRRQRKARVYTLAQQRRDPAKRAKLHISKLTPPQQAQRRMRLRRTKLDKDPLYQPTATLQGYRLADAVDKINKGEFEPRERELATNLRNTTTQGTALAQRGSDYYKQLAQREAGAVHRQSALGEMLNKRLDTVGAQANQSFDAAQAAENQRRAKDEEVRGAGLSGGTNVESELSALRGRAATHQQAAGTDAALQTGNWAAFQEALRGARDVRGGEVQGQLLNRLANQQAQLREQGRGLAQERGASRTKTLLDLRQQGFENVVTQKGLGLKEADLLADVESDRRAAQLAREKLRTTDATNRARIDATLTGQNKTVAQRAADRASREAIADANRRSREQTAALNRREKRRGGGVTPTERKASGELYSRVTNVAADIRRLRKKGLKRPLRAVVKSKGATDLEYELALDVATHGKLSPVNRRRARRIGLIVPPEWR